MLPTLLTKRTCSYFIYIYYSYTYVLTINLIKCILLHRGRYGLHIFKGYYRKVQ